MTEDAEARTSDEAGEVGVGLGPHEIVDRYRYGGVAVVHRSERTVEP
jgi:hypothetical protein